MTLREISSWINRNSRYKLAPDQIVLIIDMVNKLAVDQDMGAFKYWDNELTVWSEITLDSSGYTNCIASDIGKAVVGGVSGTTGLLKAYNNTTRKWAVATTDDFTAEEAITITAGTGAGDLEDEDYQEGYKGPYAFPTSPPVRKMVGITTFSDPRLFGTQYTYLSERDDYGVILPEYDERKFYSPARIDRFAQTYTFISAPSLDSDTTTYRWVYFRGADDITDLDADDANLMVEDLFHMEFVQACIAMGKVGTEDGSFDRSTIEKYFWGWWNRLRKNYTPMGKMSNQTNEGNVELDI